MSYHLILHLWNEFIICYFCEIHRFTNYKRVSQMQYETVTNYRFYLSNNVPDQSLSNKEQTRFLDFGKIKEPNHRLIWTGFPCASKMAQLNEIQKMKMVFNIFILIICSWKRMIHDQIWIHKSQLKYICRSCVTSNASPRSDIENIKPEITRDYLINALISVRVMSFIDLFYTNVQISIAKIFLILFSN